MLDVYAVSLASTVMQTSKSCESSLMHSITPIHCARARATFVYSSLNTSTVFGECCEQSVEERLALRHVRKYRGQIRELVGSAAHDAEIAATQGRAAAGS